jgi:hypothetical protein
MQVWRERSLRATIALLVASWLLILPALADIGVSLPYLGALVGLAAVFGAARRFLTDLPTVLGHDLGTYGQDLWLAPLVGALAVVLVAPDGSPVELQAVGGIVGLVGMANYFLRPLYFLVYGLVRRLVAARDGQ